MELLGVVSWPYYWKSFHVTHDQVLGDLRHISKFSFFLRNNY